MVWNAWFDIRVLVVFAILSLLLYVPLGFFAFEFGVPIILIVLFTLVGFILQYIVGCKMAIWNVSVHDVPDEGEWIEEIVRKNSKEMGIKTPDIYIGEIGGPNAFAVGRRRNGTIVLSESLVHILTKKELEGVIIHELSHIYSRDTIPMVIGQSVAVFVKLFIMVILAPLSQSRSKLSLSDWAGHISHIVVLSVVFLISRQREFLADKDSKENMGTGVYLSRALLKVNGVYSEDNLPSPPPEVEVLCISDGFMSSNWKSTHPSVEERVENLLND